MNLGGPELLIVLGVIILLFGAKKLPELARSLGKSSSEFKKGMQEGEAASGKQEPPKAEPEVKKKDAEQGPSPVGDAQP